MLSTDVQSRLWLGWIHLGNQGRMADNSRQKSVSTDLLSRTIISTSPNFRAGGIWKETGRKGVRMQLNHRTQSNTTSVQSSRCNHHFTSLIGLETLFKNSAVAQTPLRFCFSKTSVSFFLLKASVRTVVGGKDRQRWQMNDWARSRCFLCQERNISHTNCKG